jgi:hypothetical protein
MALTEQRIVKSVTINNPANAAEVLWADQILRDGEFVSETLHRKAYPAESKTEFLAEVENADAYLIALGWS